MVQFNARLRHCTKGGVLVYGLADEMSVCFVIIVVLESNKILSAALIQLVCDSATICNRLGVHWRAH